MSMEADRERSAGALYAVLAYGIWGVAPIYWKATRFVPPAELLAYRVLWSFAVALVLIVALRNAGGLWRALRSPRSAAAAVVAGLLLAANWLTFIWAVQHDRILATSLGYYINPLVNVLFGLVLLRERLTRAQSLAVLLAGAGVALETIALGELPWIALVLAGSFGLYGLVRKLGPAAPLTGFAIETLTLAPLALAYLASLDGAGSPLADADTGTQLLIAGSGPLTAAPLLAFASAAKRLPLSLLGMFQYIAPSIALVIAVSLYGEPFTRAHLASFGCVWLALGLTMWDSFQRMPRQAVATAQEEA
jgi:chloramphenicol-sensitive protein RarD